MQNAALDSVTDAIVVDESSDGVLEVVLFPNKGDKTNWNKSVNAQLLEKGLAAIRNHDDLPSEASQWAKIEEDARENQVGIWQYGGNIDDDNE